MSKGEDLDEDSEGLDESEELEDESQDKSEGSTKGSAKNSSLDFFSNLEFFLLQERSSTPILNKVEENVSEGLEGFVSGFENFSSNEEKSVNYNVGSDKIGDKYDEVSDDFRRKDLLMNAGDFSLSSQNSNVRFESPETRMSGNFEDPSRDYEKPNRVAHVENLDLPFDDKKYKVF